MVDLLYAILARTDDLKGFTANQVVWMWPAHFEQFGKFQTAMGEVDREVLHITDVKAVQVKINANSKEQLRFSMPSWCCAGLILPLRRLPGAFGGLGNLWKKVSRMLRPTTDQPTQALNMPQLPWWMRGLGRFTPGSEHSGHKL